METKQRSGRVRRLMAGLWRGTAALGLLGVVALSARSGGPSRRNGRRTSDSESTEPPPVSDEERLVEPLGPRVAWGQLDEIDGKYATTPFLLTRQYILLGRQAGCDIILDDDKASRYHAMLAWDHGRGVLHDNGSLNGTLVNGQRAVGPVVIRHGDIIEIQASKFRFAYAPETGLNVLEAQPTEKIALPLRPPAAEPAPAIANARLTALTGPEPGRSWPVGASLVTIGRGLDNLVVLPHASVSRHHAQIMSQANGIYIQDVGSSNGTSVNGEALSAPRRLGDGDHIQVGDVLLVLAVTAGAQPALSNAPAEPPTHRMPSAPPAAPPAGHGPPAAPPAGYGPPARPPAAPNNAPPARPPAAPPANRPAPNGPSPAQPGWPAPNGTPVPSGPPSPPPGWSNPNGPPPAQPGWPAPNGSPAPSGPPSPPPGWPAPNGLPAPAYQGWSAPPNGPPPASPGWSNPNGSPPAAPGADDPRVPRFRPTRPNDGQ